MNYGHDAWNRSDTTEPTMRYYPNAVSPATGKVMSVTDSFGNTAEFSYKSLATGGIYKKANAAGMKYPFADITAPIGVVSTLTRNNGAAGTNTTEYSYEDLLVHMRGKGLLGMAKFQAENKVLGACRTERTGEWDKDYFIPKLTTSENTVGDGTEYTTVQTAIIGKRNTAYLAYPEKTEITDADGYKTVKTCAIDPECGYLKETRTVYDDGSYEAQEYGSHVKKGGKWLAGEITMRKKHTDDDAEYADKTEYVYDESGNRISIDDPDAGITESEYDAEGKIIRQKDGRGTVKTFKYDPLGRLVRSTGALMDIFYSYDKRGNVVTEEYDNSRKMNVYDKYNRLTAEYRDYNDGEEQRHKFKYDKFGNVTEETYSDGLAVHYVYDAYGNHTASVIGGDTVWAAKSDDGRTIKESLYGGRLTHVSNYNENGRLSELCLLNGDEPVRSIKYQYDAKTGNLKRRDGMKSQESEAFTYDSMDRLTESRIEPGLVSKNPFDNMYPGTGLVQVNGAVLPSIPGINDKVFFRGDKYKYSDDGNIIESSSAGNYTYSEGRPHAVESVSNPRNAVPSCRQDIYYNDIGKTDGILEKSESGELYLDFYYGPDDERWITNLTRDNKPVKTIHFGKDYEKVDDDGVLREFSYLCNGLLQYRENGGEGRFLYMFTDSQGSVTDICDRDGNTLFHAVYDPWGNMTVTKNDIGFIRGYTGHEMLREFGLINMNGRLYDPKLVRFLSPDRFVQMPDNSQSFNRYSYCLNNPLKYTDPSGEYAVVDDIFMFLAGGTFNLAFGLASGEVHGFWHGTELFLMGGVAGVLAEYGGPTAGALVLGAGNSIINQGNANGWGNISWSEVATSTIMSGLTSAMGEYLAMNFSSTINSLMPKVGNELLQNMLNQGATNGLTGFVLGSAMTLSCGGDLGDALKSGGMDGLGGAVTGAINGAAFEIRTARSERRSPWTGEKTNGHHSYPKFLGGDVDQELTTMSVSRHKAFHREFGAYLKDIRGEGGPNMVPSRYNNSEKIQHLDTSIRFKVTKGFYDKHSVKYWDAKYDFYKNNGIIWRWRPW